MNYYTIVDEDSGMVLSNGYTPADLNLISVPPNGQLIEGVFGNYSQFYNGTEFQELPEKPGQGYLFDRPTVSWYADANLVEPILRQQRNELLKESDWTQMPDSPLSTTQKELWATYRQELRDLTEQVGFPVNVVMPTPP